MLREIRREINIEIPYYTDSKQLCSLSGNTRKDINHDPLKYIAEYFSKHRGVVFAIGDTRKTDEDCMYCRELLDIVYLAKEQNCTLILITPDPVWHRLAQLGMLTVLDKPELDERCEQIQTFINAYKTRFTVEWDGYDIIHAATLTSGFTEVQINNILSSIIMENKGLYKKNISELAVQKGRLYAAVPCVQKVSVKDVEVSGLQRLKQWLASRKKIFFMPEEVLAKRSIKSPKGILLAGVPGCGKSFSAMMVAHDWELPLYRFDIGSVYDKWVGESERKMRDALGFIDSVAPCVVWIDEIEKALAVSDGGNDVGKRVMGQFLFWLQESTSRVFLVATANNIGNMPPELFRKGRFSEVFFVDLPTPQERLSAIKLYCRKCLRNEFDQNELEMLVEATDGFSYADIEYVVKECAQEALIYGDEAVDFAKIMNLIKENVPFSKSNPDDVAAIRKWGRERAVTASI